MNRRARATPMLPSRAPPARSPRCPGADLLRASNYFSSGIFGILVGIAQQFIQRSLGAGLRIHALDDDGAGETVLAVRRRQRARYHDRARRNSAIQNFVPLPIVNARALSDKNAHGNDGTGLDHDTLDDFRARADEAVVFDDRGAGLQGF